MRTGAVLIALVLSSCCATARRQALRVTNAVGLGVATSAIVCDWGQTHALAELDWHDGRFREANPLLGDAPSTSRVAVYFVAFELAAIIGWKLLPERLRPLVWAPIAVNQIRVINHNRRAVSTCAL